MFRERWLPVALTAAALFAPFALVGGAVLAEGKSAAQVEVPYGDAPVRFHADSQVLRVAASGLSDGRGRLVGQGVRARAMAEARALRRLQQHVDGVLERASVAPQLAERVHAALAASAKVVATRALADGSVVVLMDAPVAPLSEAWPEGRDAWGR